MKQCFLLLTLGLGFTSLAQAQSADETAVKSLIESFNAAFNAHDTKAFAAAFTEDADFTNWVGQSAHGRANIETFHVPILTVVYKNGAQKIANTKIRFIRPDVAAVDVQTDVTGGKTFDGKDMPPIKFLMNWVATKEPDGRWLIKVMHNSKLLDTGIPPVYKK
ncbi:SgcJ/EcaC family oxidoreductase [Hymenobacter properus]|uniref:SgcJ/EcaC family oxidoreductase n=1 Tax=Hymenobacter properus TaxID=2791026 RepID=A0A931BGS9_9BACT|nr:SgcJ/EcaC family oxidoreductase [Hymenobacter properus]MBF9143269.1 SgcJ/EcaC family oxidoreductase [Hymenobacter properus]MBR7722079.1 SgcJ/EcaC family oxidoreductase [Microvirga sp. SRT04]